MVLPIGAEQTYEGNIDLLTRKAIIWKGEDLGAKYEVNDDIPEEMKDKVEEYRHKLIEKIVETDEALLDKYLSGTEPTLDELRDALKTSCNWLSISSNLCRNFT